MSKLQLGYLENKVFEDLSAVTELSSILFFGNRSNKLSDVDILIILKGNVTAQIREETKLILEHYYPHRFIDSIFLNYSYIHYTPIFSHYPLFKLNQLIRDQNFFSIGNESISKFHSLKTCQMDNHNLLRLIHDYFRVLDFFVSRDKTYNWCELKYMFSLYISYHFYKQKLNEFADKQLKIDSLSQVSEHALIINILYKKFSFWKPVSNSKINGMYYRLVEIFIHSVSKIIEEMNTTWPTLVVDLQMIDFKIKHNDLTLSLLADDKRLEKSFFYDYHWFIKKQLEKYPNMQATESIKNTNVYLRGA
tara:strand:+ start:33778 stop:34695 length:918 start_codon:yes stop_codon:yes gene_type:complete